MCTRVEAVLQFPCIDCKTLSPVRAFQLSFGTAQAQGLPRETLLTFSIAEDLLSRRRQDNTILTRQRLGRPHGRQPPQNLPVKETAPSRLSCAGKPLAGIRFLSSSSTRTVPGTRGYRSVAERARRARSLDVGGGQARKPVGDMAARARRSPRQVAFLDATNEAVDAAVQLAAVRL